MRRSAFLALVLLSLCGCELSINWASVSATLRQVPTSVASTRVCLVPELTEPMRAFELDATPAEDNVWVAHLPRVDRGQYTVVAEGYDDAGRIIASAVREGTSFEAGSNELGLLFGPPELASEHPSGGCPSVGREFRLCEPDHRCEPGDFEDPDNLVRNGNFEDPPIDGAFVATTPTGWRWDAGNTELVHCSHFAPAEGCQAVELAGANAYGLLAQNMDTEPGTPHCLSFSYAASPNEPEGWAEADVNMLGAAYSLVRHIFHTSASPGDLRFQKMWLGFTPASNQTTLRFIPTSDSQDHGMLIDAVRVVAEPCPAIECLDPSPVAPDELLTNGGFETPSAGTISSHTSPNAWDHVPETGHFVEVVGPQQWPPRGGCHSVYLAEKRGIAGVQQRVATTPGAEYCLSFYLSNWPFKAGGGANGFARVIGESTVLELELRHDFASRENMDYRPVSGSFTADAEESTVIFVGHQRLPGGLVVDDASLVPGACPP